MSQKKPSARHMRKFGGANKHYSGVYTLGKKNKATTNNPFPNSGR